MRPVDVVDSLGRSCREGPRGACGWPCRVRAAGRPHGVPALLSLREVAREAFVGFVLVLIASGVASRSRLRPAVVSMVYGLACWISGSSSAAHSVALAARSVVDASPP